MNTIAAYESRFSMLFALDQLAPSDGIMDRYMNESPF
jgi:hypothetical protein